MELLLPSGLSPNIRESQRSFTQTKKKHAKHPTRCLDLGPAFMCCACRPKGSYWKNTISTAEHGAPANLGWRRREHQMTNADTHPEAWDKKEPNPPFGLACCWASLGPSLSGRTHREPKEWTHIVRQRRGQPRCCMARLLCGVNMPFEKALPSVASSITLPVSEDDDGEMGV